MRAYFALPTCKSRPLSLVTLGSPDRVAELVAPPDNDRAVGLGANQLRERRRQPDVTADAAAEVARRWQSCPRRIGR